MRVTGPEGGVDRQDMVAGLGWVGFVCFGGEQVCKDEVVLKVGEGWRRGAEGNAGQPGRAGLLLHRNTGCYDLNQVDLYWANYLNFERLR